MSRPSSIFKYAGPAWLQGGMSISENGGPDTPMQLGERSFEIIEYLSYEPSAYIWSSMWEVVDVCGVIWAIEEADIMDYYGFCGDCMKLHGPNPIDCEYARMID